MRFAVDTNLLIVANGRNTNASAACRLASIDFLASLIKTGRIVIDEAGLVEEEYRKNLDLGQPGVGNLFFQHFVAAASSRLERIPLAVNASGDFADFTCKGDLKNFDRSDRKFGALSKVAKCPVANATDSDWLDMKPALEKDGVRIHFVCGCKKSDWFTA